MDINGSTILRKIKAARVTKGLSQKDMAKQLDVSISTYSRLESGVTKISYDMILKISNILSLTLYDTDSNILSEEQEKYDALSSDNKLSELINLLEEQQRLNRLILKKLKGLKI